MRVLLIKTSSMGDVIHTLPAVTEAARQVPGIRFDWVVEEGFAQIPSWHPAVDRVIPVAQRRWRRQLWRTVVSGEWARFRQALRARRYDLVIDAQGLLKSVWIARMARGKRCGLSKESAREPWVSWFYQQPCFVKKGQHAITRVRQLFAACLGYPTVDDEPDYGLRRPAAEQAAKEAYLVFLHGTAWTSKLWPESYWIELVAMANREGLAVHLPWGTQEEGERARRIAAAGGRATVLERMDLEGMARVLSGARGVVAVDTGLAHLSAALAIPSVTIYGASTPVLTGARGVVQTNLRADFPCSPCIQEVCAYEGPAEVEPACYASLPPATVWDHLTRLMA